MKINGVEFLPSSLVTCFVGNLEVRIVELGLEGFSFRTAKKLNKIERLTLQFLQFKQSSYHSLVLEPVETSFEEKEFFRVYTISTEDLQYRHYASQIIKEYGRYISLKLSGDDAYLSQEMAGYPAQEEDCFYQTFEEQKEHWYKKLDKSSGLIEKDYELALNLDTPERYTQYLTYGKQGKYGIEKLQEAMLLENKLSGHPLFQKKAARLYIGNSFCHNLLPGTGQYEVLMNQAKQDKLALTLVFTYVRDSQVEETRACIKRILDWCRKNQYPVELVVNDWGMIKLAEELEIDQNPYLSLNFGILLNKRRKDPRYKYKQGIEKNVDKLAENNLNGVAFAKWLRKKWNIVRYEYDCGSLPVHMPDYGESLEPSGISLHIPYYQTNTSQYCPLYAKCAYGDRGNQHFVTNCPKYCEQAVFLYPKHLHMIGRFNSLFGYHPFAFQKEEIEQYLSRGIDRIVVTVW